jgi:hypothetical protein
MNLRNNTFSRRRNFQNNLFSGRRNLRNINFQRRRINRQFNQERRNYNNYYYNNYYNDDFNNNNFNYRRNLNRPVISFINVDRRPIIVQPRNGEATIFLARNNKVRVSYY